MYEVMSRLTDVELHRLIDRLNPELRAIETFDGKERVKEFYAMTAEDAFGLLECIAKISGTQDRLRRLTPEGHEIIDEEIAEEVRNNAKRGPFRFSMCGIPVGSELVYVEDESFRPTVHDDRRIRYEGEITSLSAFAQRLKGLDHPVQGALWFAFQGEKLADIRDRIESNSKKIKME